ncbi:MAG: carbonic anhydrase family protein [Reinekea sp.]
MKSFLTCAVLIAASASSTFASEKSHWGYSGDEGPKNWAKLSPDYSFCGSGKNQSPINLTGFIESELSKINFNYKKGGNEILNNGHTIQVNYPAGSTISLNGHQYELKQYHFHAPSENLINGKSYPMEAHFVHADKDGNLAVIAVMLKEGKENPTLAKAWKHIPEREGKVNTFQTAASAWDILPANKEYYRFNGSLTTPPCTEGVTWLVMKNPVTVSKAQIEKFSNVMHHPDNRPLQALNARVVLK